MYHTTAKLSSEKQKNSSFPKKKSLIGSTPVLSLLAVIRKLVALFEIPKCIPVTCVCQGLKKLNFDVPVWFRLKLVFFNDPDTQKGCTL